MAITGKKLKRLLRIYPPYIGAGIKVESISPDWRKTIVSMKVQWYNRNAVGTHFGGSLYSMVDPHFMLMLMNILGHNYIIWDKSASIEFVKASKEKITATFLITEKIIDKIKQETSNGEKYLPDFSIDIVDSAGNIVAKVNKKLYIRRKKA